MFQLSLLFHFCCIILLFFKCLSVILDWPRNIFESCSYCKCIYVLTKTFLPCVWRMFQECCYFFSNCKHTERSIIYWWLLSETRGDIWNNCSQAICLSQYSFQWKYCQKKKEWITSAIMQRTKRYAKQAEETTPEFISNVDLCSSSESSRAKRSYMLLH